MKNSGKKLHRGDKEKKTKEGKNHKHEHHHHAADANAPKWLKQKSRVGWASYYELRREHHHTLDVLRQTIQDANLAPNIPQHINDDYRRLVATYDGHEYECPICLEKITWEGSHLTECGHLFHKSCVATLDTCPTCRGKYVNKRGAPQEKAVASPPQKQQKPNTTGSS